MKRKPMNTETTERRTSGGTYLLVSLAFVAVNLLTLQNLLPWIDEVMILDTAYQAAFQGSWETTAWYRVAGQYPFSTYPPLYQMLAALWMMLFGGGIVAVRSLNLLVVFVMGGVCLRLVRRYLLPLHPWQTALFALLLWGTAEIAWMYRNGRPDMLCALLLVLSVQAIGRHLAAPSISSRIAVAAMAALLVGTGIQAAVCLLALWLFGFIVLRGKRRLLIRLLALLLTGMLLGVLAICLFMWMHGRLLGFACSIIQYSATLSAAVLALLPWVGELWGFSTAAYTEKLTSLSVESGLTDRLAEAFACRSFLLLAIATLVAYLLSFRRRLSALCTDKGFQLWMVAVYVPVIMTFAGRFVNYYFWMSLLPLVVSATVVAACHRWSGMVMGVMALLLTGWGVESMSDSEGNAYRRLQSFVHRQQFKPTDAVVAPFSLFYELKPLCRTCYFAGIFPAEYIGRVDYVIEAPDGNEYNRPISDYLDQLRRDTTLIVTAVDRMQHPALILYQIQEKKDP